MGTGRVRGLEVHTKILHDSRSLMGGSFLYLGHAGNIESRVGTWLLVTSEPKQLARN